MLLRVQGQAQDSLDGHGVVVEKRLGALEQKPNRRVGGDTRTPRRQSVLIHPAANTLNNCLLQIVNTI
jgi:hypothetical protein